MGPIWEISRLDPEESSELRGCSFESFYPHGRTESRSFITPRDNGGQESGASSKAQPGQAGGGQDRSASWGSPLGSVSCRIPEHSGCPKCRRRPTPAVAEFQPAAPACSSQSSRRRGRRSCGGPGVERKGGGSLPASGRGRSPRSPSPPARSRLNAAAAWARPSCLAFPT